MFFSTEKRTGWHILLSVLLIATHLVLGMVLVFEDDKITRLLGLISAFLSGAFLVDAVIVMQLGTLVRLSDELIETLKKRIHQLEE